jgi:uncharacterized protein (DUF2336 family)
MTNIASNRQPSPFDHLRNAQQQFVAQYIGKTYSPSSLMSAEFKIANALILEALTNSALEVRAALSAALASNPLAPKEIMLRLANDADVVAIPVLRTFKNLTGQEILHILGSNATPAKIKAVAEREGLPISVSEFICRVGDLEAVETLMKNDTAEIEIEDIQISMDRFKFDKRIHSAIARRSDVPFSVVARLIKEASSVLAETAVSGVTRADLIQSITRPASKALIGLSSYYSDSEIKLVLSELHSEGHLSDKLILRSLCLANIQFFSIALSIRSSAIVKKRISPSAIMQDMIDAEPEKIRLLVSNAKLPERWIFLLERTCEVLKATGIEFTNAPAEVYASRLAERILMLLEEDDLGLSETDIDAILDISRMTKQKRERSSL